MAEHLHDSIRARSLFATHYHELTALTHECEGVRNYNVAVREWNEQIIFLRKIVAGAADRSYGIQVARLAGLPDSIIIRARQLLATLEEEAAATAVSATASRAKADTKHAPAAVVEAGTAAVKKAKPSEHKDDEKDGHDEVQLSLFS